MPGVEQTRLETERYVLSQECGISGLLVYSFVLIGFRVSRAYIHPIYCEPHCGNSPTRTQRAILLALEGEAGKGTRDCRHCQDCCKDPQANELFWRELCRNMFFGTDCRMGYRQSPLSIATPM